MEHSHFFEQDDSHTTAFSLADFSAELYEQRFDIAPLDVPTRRAGEDQFESSLVLALHTEQYHDRVLDFCESALRRI